MRLSDNKRNAANGAKREYLLSGLIVCDCGAAYIGRTSVSHGQVYRVYACGEKYRQRTCGAKNIKADEIESFVIENLKEYLYTLDIKSAAARIADEVNNAEPDASAEKKELASINAQIQNGMAAILKGMDFPELQDEITRLRTRKGELEDVIRTRETTSTRIDPEKIEAAFAYSVAHIADGNMREIIKRHVTKIYAHSDGSYDVELGVYTNGCGDAPLRVTEPPTVPPQERISNACCAPI